MNKILLFLLFLCFSLSGIAQNISILEYSFTETIGKGEVLNFHSSETDKKKHLKIIATNNGISILQLQVTLNSRLYLIDSLIVNDSYGNKMLRGFFLDTVSGNYENINLPFHSLFPYMGGIKSGKFLWYENAADSSNSPVYIVEEKNYRFGKLHGFQKTLYPKTNRPKSIEHYDNGLKHGEFIAFHSDSSFSMTANYENDKLNGKFTEYFFGNRIYTITYYRDDKKHGEHIRFHPNGGLNYNCKYYQDKLNGIAMTWLDNGRLIDSCYYQMGLKHGKSVKYFPDGKLKELAFFKNGQSDSIFKEWTIQGKLIEDAYFSDGAKNGNHKTWDDDGNLILSYSYVNNELHGFNTEYYPNGKIKCQTNYESGKRKGKTVCYDEKGKKTIMENVSYPLEIPIFDEIIEEEINQQEEIVQEIIVWESPTILIKLPLNEESKKTLKKAKGMKFEISIEKNGTYKVGVHATNKKSKAARKAIPQLENSLIAKPFKLNGKPLKTMVIFTLE